MVDEPSSYAILDGIQRPHFDDIISELKRVSICMGCGEEIFDRYILRVAPDLEWHAACLKCEQCHRFLDENCTAFVRDGKTYCKLDYVRLFTVKCASCHNQFGKNDFVMRAKTCVYHVNCFRCGCCDRRLLPGDEFALKDDQLFCKTKCQLPRTNFASTLDDDGSLLSLNPLSSMIDSHKQLIDSPPMSAISPSKSDTEVVTTTINMITPSTTSSSSCSSSSKKQRKDKPKTTRVRTVLNEKQLMTLRTCYAANSRPDALMKEQLTEMTGLSARVIRVWFQNKRCKDKKRQIAMKQLQQAQEKVDRALNGVRMQGIGPLIAMSPGTHDLGSAAGGQLLSQLDIQQYAQSAALWAGMDCHVVDRTPPFQPLLHSFDSGDSATFLVPPSTCSSYAPSSTGVELDSFSPQMNTSDLSSPSCSE